MLGMKPRLNYVFKGDCPPNKSLCLIMVWLGCRVLLTTFKVSLELWRVWRQGIGSMGLWSVGVFALSLTYSSCETWGMSPFRRPSLPWSSVLARCGQGPLALSLMISSGLGGCRILCLQFNWILLGSQFAHLFMLLSLASSNPAFVLHIFQLFVRFLKY